MKNSIKSRIKNFRIRGDSISGYRNITPSPWGDIYTDIYPMVWVESVITAESEKEALDIYLEEVLEVFILEVSLIARQFLGNYHVIFTHPYQQKEPLIVKFNVMECYEKAD